MPEVTAGRFAVDRFGLFAEIDAAQIRLIRVSRAGAEMELCAAVGAEGDERRGKDVVQFQVAERKLPLAVKAADRDRPLCTSGHKRPAVILARSRLSLPGDARAAPARYSRSAPGAL